MKVLWLTRKESILMIWEERLLSTLQKVKYTNNQTKNKYEFDFFYKNSSIFYYQIT